MTVLVLFISLYSLPLSSVARFSLREMEKIRIQSFFLNSLSLYTDCRILSQKTPYFVRVDPCLVLNTDFSILNTDQHRQNTEFFSLKHWSPYIDINRLEKNFGSVFFAVRAVLFYLYFFSKNFLFSVFSWHLLRCGHMRKK